jgi:CelD/BcsL family acetyltransferase involved in cellulose biosynthesis
VATAIDTDTVVDGGGNMVLLQAADVFREKATRPTEWRVDAITDYADFVALEAIWNALVERAGIDYPFLRHEWLRTWWDCFGAGKKLHVLLVWSRDELVGAAPLMLTHGRMYGVPVRRLEFIFNVHTPRMDVIVGRAPREVYRALWKYLHGHRNLWDVVALYQLPAESPALDELRQAAERDGFLAGQWRSDDSPYLDLQGLTADSYQAALGTKHKSNMRNRTKRLARTGTVALETVPGRLGLPEALEDGYRIEAAAWKGEARTAIRCDEALQRFYSGMARVAAARGWLRLDFLTVNGRRIAFGYSLVYGQRLYLLKAGYDPEFFQYSPFNLLCERTIESCFEMGFKEFDFLGSAADWKMKWTSTTRPHYWLFLFSPRARARLVHWAKFRLAAALRERPLMRPFVSWIQSRRGAATQTESE